MKSLSLQDLKHVAGGDGGSSQEPAKPTGTDKDGNPTYSCPDGTFPAQLPNGDVVCVKP